MISRRAVVAGIGALAATPALGAPSRRIRLYAGTYAREGGKGVYPVAFDPGADRWSIGAPISGVDDASFAVRGTRVRYVVEERGAGVIATHDIAWARRAVAPSGGADPCHLALDAGERHLAVANYSSGTVALFPLDAATGLPGAPRILRHAGHGPDAARQEGPHAHWVGFTRDGRWLHSVDLGADAIFAHRVDGGETITAWRAPAGSGPRHLVRHPHLPRAYVVSEMANTLTTLEARADATFATLASVSTLAPGFAGKSQAAHIAIDPAGTRLYVSNRGADTIAVFVLGWDGAATPIQQIACGGRWPRMFHLMPAERRMLVANERSGEIAVFRIGSDGRLTPTATRLAVPGVVFLGV